MCRKQAAGLGRYLHDIDPTRTWQMHVQHVIVFCRIHYARNLRPHRKHPQYETMRNLPLMSSREEVTDFLRDFRHDPQIGGWVRQKECSWVCITPRLLLVYSGFGSDLDHRS